MRKSVEKTGIALPSDDVATILGACFSAASFWLPEQVGPQIAWLDHAPFAFWLMDSLRPGVVVELGTHGGFSYFSLCQAAQSLNLEVRCYAVDTWKGDEHAGFYGDEVFQQVEQHNRRRYSAFSSLIRSTFDAALSHFRDGGIDLLHIDGRHSYDSVYHDFVRWQPKPSRCAVVLFHDTNVRENDFGVCRLWEELSRSFPHFEFLHGHGLGVLGVGENLSDPLRRLFSLAADPEAVQHVRNGYARLGSTISLQFRVDQLQRVIEDQKQELARQARNSSGLQQEMERALEEQVREHSTQLGALQQLVIERESRLSALQQQVAARDKELVELRRAVAKCDARMGELNRVLSSRTREIALVRASTSWRITAPLRSARRLLQRRKSGPLPQESAKV
jgi:hypothetical protein